MAEVGSKRKREVAMMITSFLDQTKRYSAKEIERFISENVRPVILEIPGMAPDHIRRAMIENGYVERDEISNETWVASSFVGYKDRNCRRLKELEAKQATEPDSLAPCPECGRSMTINKLLKHYRRQHSQTEEWERLLEEYFGYV
jgi:hypothetical protein